MAPVLVAALEQELHPEADPEEGAVGGDPVPDRVDEAAPREAGHRRRGRADAGDDEAVGPGQVRRAPHHDHVGARDTERLVDADEVAGAVVDDGDLRHPRLPFVEATPARRGSGRRPPGGRGPAP